MTGLARIAALGIAVGVVLGASNSASAAPINLLTNGDFSAGDVGFTSEYTFKAPGTSGMVDPGVFSVAPSATGNHGLWETTGDHTTGAGSFLLVNGFTDRPGRTVWSETVTVDQNVDYFFEAFAKNLCCTTFTFPTANLSFLINGILIGSGAGSGSPGLWANISTMWNSGVATSALLEIRDGSTVYEGNDFGLDDIYFGTEIDPTTPTPAPEPASLALLGTGALLAAWRERRRRRNRT